MPGPAQLETFYTEYGRDDLFSDFDGHFYSRISPDLCNYSRKTSKWARTNDDSVVQGEVVLRLLVRHLPDQVHDLLTLFLIEKGNGTGMFSVGRKRKDSEYLLDAGLHFPPFWMWIAYAE
jgi:hypothetical protein